MSTFNFWASVPLGVHSFIIYSFLPDPLVLETSRLDIKFWLYHLQLFSSRYELTVQGLSFWQSLNFLKLINIFLSSFLYFPSCNRQTTIFSFVKPSIQFFHKLNLHSLKSNISISISNDTQTLNRLQERPDKFIYTYRNISCIHNKYTRSIDKNTQMCPNR